MPPHCDALDGPVVRAAQVALAASDVDLVLPYVQAAGEGEVREAFDRTLKVAQLGGEARDVAERWFFETVVRVHRAGEGAPYDGLKPAGLDVGPVIPVAEQALADGSPDALVDILCGEVQKQVSQRLGHASELKARTEGGVAASREYVEAMLGLQVWANTVYRQLTASAHARLGADEHG